MKPGSFELTCSFTIDDVADIRRVVERLHGRLIGNDDDVSRVAMATHELLENAVKFSADGTTMLRIDVVDQNCVEITTRNVARDDDLAGLRTLAKELEAAPDPMMFYLELMGRRTNKRGGLGIGRIAAEADMKMRIDLEGNLVQVSARAQLAQPIAIAAR